MPDFLLKNLPKEDWSEKLSVVDISCADSFEWRKRFLASLYSISNMKSDGVCPVIFLTISDR